MSQPGLYQHEIQFPDLEGLRRVVRHLLDEDDHAHNFEVWIDERTLRVNDLGLHCVLLTPSPHLAGMSVKDPT